MRRMVLLLLLVTVVMLPGCKELPEAPVDAVRSYLAGLPQALHAETVDGIAPYSTDEQIERVTRYVGMYLGEGKRVSAQLRSLSFEGAEVKGGSATVQTREDWLFSYTDKATGRVVSSESYALEMKYHLVMQDGQWLIADAEELHRRTSR